MGEEERGTGRRGGRPWSRGERAEEFGSIKVREEEGRKGGEAGRDGGSTYGQDWDCECRIGLGRIGTSLFLRLSP